MSWKNTWLKKEDKTLLTFQDRLLFLMFEIKNLNTTDELAENLTAYIQIKTSNSNIKQSSINQKIKEHLANGTEKEAPECLSLRYLQAYAKYFGCSIDFLLGTTPYITTSYDIRKICELTGLSEKIVERLIDMYEIEKNIPAEYKFLRNTNIDSNAKFWRDLLNDEKVFFQVPNEWNRMQKSLNQIRDIEKKIQSINKYLENGEGEIKPYREHDINFIDNSPEKLEINDGINEMLKKNIPTLLENQKNYEDVYYGRLQYLLDIIKLHLENKKNSLLKSA